MALPQKFKDLSGADRRRVTERLAELKRRGYFARAKYNPVSGADQTLRERLYAEKGGEETALTIDERNRLIALARDMARNGETMSALMRQFRFNVVGTCGGKACFEFGAAYTAVGRRLQRAFAAWARSAEFFDGLDFQAVLDAALQTKLLTGRAVLLFDDGLISDSGKIIVFEGDAVANIDDKAFAERVPGGWTQHQGLVKDANGVTRGAFVSMSQRGQNTFALTDKSGRPAVFYLCKEADAAWVDSPFLIFSHAWRVNQTVAVPGVHASLGSMIDLEAATKYELQAAKKNAQTIGQVTQTAETADPTLTDDLDPDATAPVESGVKGEGAAAGAGDDDEQVSLDLDVIKDANVLYDVMPPGVKMELFDTKHPNSNMPEFIRWISGRVGWSNGVGSVYATGKADSSYTAFRGEQVMSWPAFEHEQHLLESRICDWAVRRWFAWATRKGLVDPRGLPDGWLDAVAWQWPKMREVNQVDAENAFQIGLKNGTATFRDRFGPDWMRRIEQRAEERAAFEAHGMVYPGDKDNNGMIAEPKKEGQDGKDV